MVDSDEPFKRLLCQGMVLKDGAKMSKSKGNTVDPQALIEQFGADTVRLFTMFAAPPEQSLEWSSSGVEGAHRFLRRLWKLVGNQLSAEAASTSPAAASADATHSASEPPALRRKTHQVIAKVTDDYARRQTFNTAIAAIMELCNEISRHISGNNAPDATSREALETCTLLLAPITPHICHQLWRELGHDQLIIDATWPTPDATALASTTTDWVIQVNGKKRASMSTAVDSDEEELRQLALSATKVQPFTEGKVVRKVIIVPKKLINIVVS